MSVTLNESAIGNLLGQNGPVGEAVQDLALKVAIEAERNAKEIMHRQPDKVNGVGISGPNADGAYEIGTRDTGQIARYLAEKEGREWQEGRGWLVKALRTEFDSSFIRAFRATH